MDSNNNNRSNNNKNKNKEYHYYCNKRVHVTLEQCLTNHGVPSYSCQSSKLAILKFWLSYCAYRFEVLRPMEPYKNIEIWMHFLRKKELNLR